WHARTVSACRAAGRDARAPPFSRCVPAGIGAFSGTRALGVPIVSGEFDVGGVADAGGLAPVTVEPGEAIVSAIMVDPTTVFARAVGVLSSRAVEAIGVEPVVTALAALGAGAPASVFLGAAGLNESRIFCAAA